MARLLLLRERHPADHLRGKWPEPTHAEIALEDGDRAYKPDGEPLAVLLRKRISQEAAALAYPFLHGLRVHKSSNRAVYSGQEKKYRVRQDGRISNTLLVSPVSSMVIGYFDRTPRFPFCRETALVSQDPEGWGTLQPMIREVAAAFRMALPGRYAAQAAAAQSTHPAYVIPGTPFTTLTVNNNVAAAYHRDRGDFAAGFGCIAVLRRGEYSGGELVLPAYRVSANLQDRDLLLFDVHELHGNMPIVGEGHERISIVFYFRANMLECMAPEQEVERAKLARGGLDKAAGEVRGMKWRPEDP